MLVFYLVTPLGVLCLILALVLAPSKARKLVPFIGLTFGLIGYSFVTNRAVDINRYFSTLDGIREIPVWQALNWTDDGLFVKNLIFWIISQTGDNNLLPFCSLFLIYSIGSYIVIDSCERNGVTKVWLPLLMLIFLIPLYYTYSNVRNVTSFAMISLAVYRELIEKKKNLLTVMLYVLPIFIHLSGIVLVLFRISVIFIKKKPLLGFVIAVGIPTIVSWLFQNYGEIAIGGNIGIILRRAIRLSDFYLNGASA